MNTDLKVLSVRFSRPVEIKGLGMLGNLNLGLDDEGKPLNAGVIATWVAQAQGMRISTRAGETWVPVGSITSFQPLYEARPNTTPIAKRAAGK